MRVCVWYVYAYYGSRDLQTMYILYQEFTRIRRNLEFLFIFDTTCDSRMKASFLINTRNYRKRSKSIFRRFFLFIFFPFITVSIRATRIYKISITIKS